MSVKQRILDLIADRGPMSFDDYMEMCLYDPIDGFFGSGRGGPGRDRDFVTSPEVSAQFGFLIAMWAVDLDRPDDVPFVEVGAGSGALLTPVVDVWMAEGAPVYAVERSAAARAALARKLPQVKVVADLDDLPVMDHAIVIGNEVLDNMPAALARWTDGAWVEIGVGATEGTLELVEIPSRPEVAAWCAMAFAHPAEGLTVTAQLRAAEWVTDVLGRFRSVHLCLIDYAETSDVLASRPFDQLVRAYREHRPATEWLDDPGATDLTVDVNINGIVRSATEAGANVVVTKQRRFLLDHGAEEDEEYLAGEEYVAASEGRIMDQLIARSKRVDLDAVLDPEGLGGFSVFLIDSGT